MSLAMRSGAGRIDAAKVATAIQAIDKLQTACLPGILNGLGKAAFQERTRTWR